MNFLTVIRVHHLILSATILTLAPIKLKFNQILSVYFTLRNAILSTDKLKFSKLPVNRTQSSILQSVRDHSPISRSRIVSITGQPHAAVSRSTATLLDKNILVEDSLADTTGPRKKRGLRLNSDYGYVLAVEYGPDGIEGIAMNSAYMPMTHMTQEQNLTSLSRDKIIATIAEAIKELRRRTLKSPGRCLGIAAIDPGIVDDATGTSVLATTMEYWKDVPVVEILEKQFALPVMLLSTGITKIRAVDRLELNNKVDNLLYIEYGKGIGCGLKLNGQYISGESDLAGELGHLRITDEQTPCSCGGVGCLETCASLSALAKKASKAIPGKGSMLNQNKPVCGIDVLRAAAKHDRLASRIVDEAFEKLGIAVAGLVNVLNPKMVLFDSLIDNAGSEAFLLLRRVLHKNVLISHQNHLEIKISTLKTHVGAMGGAAAILDVLLRY
jgi:N-acetylglucosamine repressor